MLDEAAAIRGLEPSAVLRHALSMARQGRPIAPSAFLAPEVIANWTNWHTQHGDAVPPASLGGKEALWPLFLACRAPR
jgi:ATP-dependent DNA helicase RecQ